MTGASPNAGHPGAGSVAGAGGFTLPGGELFDLAPVGLVVLDRELRPVACNRAMSELNRRRGGSCDCGAGTATMPEAARQVEGPLRHALATGEPLSDLAVASDLSALPEARCGWLVNVQPLRDAGGTVAHLLVSVQEATGFDEARRTLRETEAVFRVSQQLNPDGFSILRAERDAAGTVRDFLFEYANPACEKAFGRGVLAGRRMTAVGQQFTTHPSGLDRHVRALGSRSADEEEFRFGTGADARWFCHTLIPIGGDRLAASFRDITRRKRDEEQGRLVTHESRHRVKNDLAVVSSLIWHARRSSGDAGTLVETLQRQVNTMAAAQDLMGREVGEPVGLENLAHAALDPFSVAPLRIESGPPVEVPAECVVPLALALHELATNALKHGALSAEGGQVVLRWTVRRGRALLIWRESGGPPVAPGAEPGFGTRLLQVVQRSLPDGEVRIDLARRGLRAALGWKLD